MNATKGMFTIAELFAHCALHRPGAEEWRGQYFEAAEAKLDGHRLTIIKGKNGEGHAGVQAFGRRWTFDEWPLLAPHEQIRRAVEAMPIGTVLDGELHSPGESSSQVPMRLKRPLSGKLRFTPFAAPVISGAVTSDNYHMGRRALEQLCSRAGLDSPPRVVRLEHHSGPDGSRAGMKGILTALAMTEGVEGWVLKSRHWTMWYKIKPVHTVDLVVIGTTPGESKYRGRVGSLVLAARTSADGQPVQLAEVARASGMTDEERDSITRLAERGELNHRVCEVKHAGVGAGGRLRFPRFVRWRPDKTPAEATRKEDL